MKKLIITVDDFGISLSLNEAIEQSHDREERVNKLLGFRPWRAVQSLSHRSFA